MKRRYMHGPSVCLGDCGRLVRPQGTKLTEFPGMVSRHANGMCRACHERRNKGVKATPVRHPTIIPCGRCGHLTRPAGTSLAQHPRTHPRVGDLCRACDSSCGQVTPEQVRYIRRELIDYYRSRGRTIPTELLEAS